VGLYGKKIFQDSCTWKKEGDAFKPELAAAEMIEAIFFVEGGAQPGQGKQGNPDRILAVRV